MNAPRGSRYQQVSFWRDASRFVTLRPRPREILAAA